MSIADLEAARKSLAALCGPPEPVTRSTFSAWPAARQAAHCRAGGRIVDDRPTARPRSRFAGAGVPVPMSRADFLAGEAADKNRKF